MTNPITSKICCCIHTNEIKEEVQQIQEEEEKLEEVLDLEKILKT